MSTSLNTHTFEVGLTPEEKRLYSSLFKALDSNSSGIIPGDKARYTFEKSGLPVPILSQIWQLADESNLGFLTQFGFCSAMRLIGYSQAGNRPMPGMAQRPGPLPKFAGLDILPSPISALQPQSTDSSSFMQSQPSAAVPTNAITAEYADSIPPILPHDLEKFRQLFTKTVGLSTGELDGNQARSIFLKTKLPHQTLGLIWGLVDTLNSGRLSLASFVVAMHLIQGLLSGAIKQLPHTLPTSVWQSVSANIANPSPSSRQSSVGSQHTIVRHNSPQVYTRAPSNLSVPPLEATMSPDFEWSVSSTTKCEYDAIFHSLDKSGSGQLSSDQVAQFLMNSNLTQEALAGIWDLLDIQNSGVFSRLEFSIALFLVNRVRAGGDLPNIVPQSLLDSLAMTSSVKDTSTVTHHQSPNPEPIQSPQKQASAIDDLAGLFSEPAPARTASPAPAIAKARTNESIANDPLPKVRTAMTGSFRPSSNFGQSLLTKSATESDRQISHKEPIVSPQPMPVAPPQVSSPIASPPALENRSVNYDALRSVPPPPVSTDPSQPSNREAPFMDRNSPMTSKALGSPGPVPRAINEDLLADSNPEVSGRLSQALSDIANYSNQIRSLSSQTSQLHEKKLRAEQEYQKVMTVKTEIEAKLRLLRESYDRELDLAAKIDTSLQTLVEQNEALRSEASIAEAKLNALQVLVREKQDALTSLEQQNKDLKQKLALLTAEIANLEEEVASKSLAATQAAKSLAVKKSQVQVVVVKVEDLKRNIADLESAFNQHQAAHAEADLEHESLQKQQTHLEQQAYESAQRVAHLKAQQDEKERQSRELADHVDALKKQNAAAQLEAERLEAALSTTGPVQTGVEKSVDHSEAIPTNSRFVETGMAGVGIMGALGLAAILSELPAQQSTPKAAAENSSDFDAPYPSIDDSNGHQSREINTQEIPDLDVEFADLTLAVEPQHEFDADSEHGAGAKAASSINTAEKESDGETAMTSPNFSDSNYNHLNDIPGAFLAPIRTDSLTSSVQNNPSMSVRDDNVENSDRDTLVHDEVARPPASQNETGSQQTEQSSLNKDSQEYLTGMFEVVDHGSLHRLTPSTEEDDSADPPHAAQRSVDDEFPPITEVEYDEDSSSDSESNHSREFDDARENLASPLSSAPPVTNPSHGQDMFDSMFDGLEPTKPESSNGFGDVDFHGLQEATSLSPGDGDLDEFANLPEFAFNESFSEAPHYQQNSAPNFGGPVEPEATNDEWDQLFAGFGNAAPSVAAAAPALEPATSSKSHLPSIPNPIPNTSAKTSTDGTQEIAISELTDMGFPREAAIEALERAQWNLEAATNRLLDNI